jgi:hypothetical protein
MSITHDRTIAWKRKRIEVTFHQYSLDTTEEVNGSGIRGIDAAASTVYDLGIKLPTDVDPRFPLGIRIHYATDSTTDTDTITWTPLYGIIHVGSALVTQSNSLPIAVTTIDGILFAHNYSARSEIAKHFASIAQIHAGAVLNFNVQLTTDIDVAGTESIWLIGIEIDYVPMKTRQPHSETDAPLNDDLQ